MKYKWLFEKKMNTKKNNTKSSNNIYNNKEYLKNNLNWHQEDSPYKVSFVKKIIKKNNISFNNCADVGCGAGYVTELLSQEYQNINFIGFDYSNDVNLFWRERSKLSNLKFVNEDISD